MRSAFAGLTDRWGIQWRSMSPEERRETLNQLYFAGETDYFGYARRFLVLLGLAIVIAACGLHANSTAVVIGAMLIAPLMDPILGLSAAIVLGWTGRMVRSVILIALGTVVSIAIAMAVGFMIPDRIVVVPEIASRTSPTLLDLGVALGAGAAAAYALTRRASVALPGVALAVALAPPLAVVGLMLEEGLVDLAAGAFVLFLTNLVAILFAAALVLLAAGVTPGRLFRQAGGRIRKGLIASALGVALVTVPLAVHSFEISRQTEIRDAVLDSMRNWMQLAPQQVLAINIKQKRIVIDVTGSKEPVSVQTLADEIAQRLGRNVPVTVRWTPRTSQVAWGRFSGERKAIENPAEAESQDSIKVH
ncbi:MAG: TIGR00341 family protein [Kiloniellales bacterium]|nr:TIGR00341 family protein [Kiloniellales bacterium]